MFRLVVVNQELFAAFVTGHPFGEDVVHRGYHYRFLPHRGQVNGRLLNSGCSTVIRVFIRLDRFAVFELIPSKPRTTVLSLLFRYGLIQFARKFEALGRILLVG